MAVRDLQRLTGKTHTSLNIVGEGCQDRYLNEMTAQATGLPVYAGPVEGTAIGVEAVREDSCAICEIDSTGTKYRICWGLVNGGRPTSELMKQYDVAIWAHHGMFASGENFDLTFGLMHTVEKSAEILVKVRSMIGGMKRQTIQPEELRALDKDFQVTLPEKFLYRK